METGRQCLLVCWKNAKTLHLEFSVKEKSFKTDGEEMKRLEINPSLENLSPADLHYRNCYRKFLRLKGNDS